MQDGKIAVGASGFRLEHVCHIRCENSELFNGGYEKLFTVFQSVSDDGGKTWSEPEMLLDETERCSLFFMQPTAKINPAKLYSKSGK